MEQINPQEIRQQQSALMQAWKRWEEDATQAPALRTALQETHTKLKAWEESGRYIGRQATLLADQASTLEALLVQRAQEQARGY